MKKIISLLVVYMFCFSCFFGCSNTSGMIESESVSNPNEQDVVLPDVIMTNVKVSIVASKNIFAKDDEMQIDITLTNQSSYDIEIAYFFLITPIIPTATNYPQAREMPEQPYLEKFNKNAHIYKMWLRHGKWY